MILSVGRSTTSRNASATLAFNQFRKAQEEDGGFESFERIGVIRIGIESVETKFRAKLHAEVAKNLSVFGPKRDSRPEAICDGLELGKCFVAEAIEGARKAARRLELRKWTLKETENADEQELEKLARTCSDGSKGVSQRLIPPGEGWTRHDEEMLINLHSQVYFAQTGRRAGQYFKRSAAGGSGGGFEMVDTPHVPREHPIVLTAASASAVRRGAKQDRAVLLNDITKIARLALKFPLSFVDTPACAYALFQGLRTVESAQWCAENFHKKLLPILAGKIHDYEMQELEAVLRQTLEALDAELMVSAHAFSGCGAVLCLVLGDRLVVAGVGRVRVALLHEKGPARPVLNLCKGDPEAPEELDRIRQAGGTVRDGALHGVPLEPPLHEAERILSARHVFEVLQLEPDASTDVKSVRSAYRKLALRVHPDKLAEGADRDAHNQAFARLDSAKDALEAMVAEDAPSCQELHRVLRSEVSTRAGAIALLGTEEVGEAEKASKEIWKRLAKIRPVAPAKDCERAEATCREAVATLQRGFSAEALPRQEALLREGLSTSRAMGARDLRLPSPVVQMRPETASKKLPNGRCRVALLCAGTASLSDQKLAESTARLTRHPKASALRWCADSDGAAACSSAVCIFAEATRAEEPAAKRLRTASSAASNEGGTVRVRHILFAHQQLRQPDPMARRQGTAKTLQEAEAVALSTLERLLEKEKDANLFLRLCRELSDCQSALQPGTLAGDLGWLGRGQQEPPFDEAVFTIGPNTIGDLVTTSRGVHIVQRLA